MNLHHLDTLKSSGFVTLLDPPFKRLGPIEQPIQYLRDIGVALLCLLRQMRMVLVIAISQAVIYDPSTEL